MTTVKLKITAKELDKTKLKKPPVPGQKLLFGKEFSDRMFIMRHTPAKGWHEAEIRQYDNLSLSPAALVLHYAPEVFEGLKAYRQPDGGVAMFRPKDNFLRMNTSAERVCLPVLDIDDALAALTELVRLEQKWVPSDNGASLYIRPTMIGVDPYIGLKEPEDVWFYIIMSPVGAYYAHGFEPVSIMVEDKYVRAVRGGLGAAKTGANYSASVLAGRLAKKKGFDQVLWLDGVEQKYVEEVGSMNIFFVYGENKIVTSALNGSILPGITRNSVLQLAKHWGVDTAEDRLDVEQVLADITSGKITEVFGSGTAAVISPVGALYRDGKEYIVGGNKTKAGALTQKLYDNLTGIQYGRIPDPFGWMVKVV
ncbi:branched chain amino acid aminotransferase [Candidatus Termititenax dinenymphae]|uniref:Branched-chain-amino-acid aminotransferase n=1 Tax=Candidatus Termititenax dinenymphae TaxID=2218523 RepID=A0A388TK19_9BACT|nr:branched chain amino acid aminotransferase [Candidatus Termititenax dinenymphae]